MINFPVSDWMPDAKIPSGPIQDKWSKYKLESKLCLLYTSPSPRD